MIENDSNDLMQKIENARSQLDAVWSHLPNMAPAERPQIEEKYFEALGDMDHLLVGERRRDFMQNASGSVYGDEYRKKLANGLPAQTAQRVEFYGINKDEFAARAGVGHVPAALETHWIERDASAIAAHMNIDMTTDEGRTEAFSRAASFHAEMMEDLTEKVELTRSDWQELERLREQFDQAASRGPTEADEAAFNSYAQKSPLHAELASLALDVEQHDKSHIFMEPAAYVAPQDRSQLNQIATERDIPLDFDLKPGHAEDRASILSAVESRYFGVVSQEETAREVRELAAKDSLSFDESRKLVEGLKAIVGETGVRDLQNGNVSEFVEHLKAANVEIDQREAYDIGETYVEAMRQHGYNMDETEKAISTDKALFELHEEREQLEEQRQLTEDARSHTLNSDRKLGL